MRLKPITHFLMIGGALFALSRAFGPDVGPQATGRRSEQRAPEPLVVSAAMIEDLRAGWVRQTGRAPSEPELRALVRQAADEEILFRSAQALGLGRVDRVVWHRLVANMRFVSQDEGRVDAELYKEAIALGMDDTDAIVRLRLIERMQERLRDSMPALEPSDEELRAYIERHPADFTEPWRVSFAHVLLSYRRRGATVENDARALLARLNTEATTPRQTRKLGDPTLLPKAFYATSASEIAKALGADFATAVAALPEQTWSGPVRSAFGLHLVRVSDRTPPRPLAFEAVRERARIGLLRERRERALAEGLAALRAGYDVRVEGST